MMRFSLDLPEEHAEPVETEIPARSKAIIIVIAFKSGEDTKLVFGKRSAFAPKILRSDSIFFKRISNESRSFFVKSKLFITEAATPKP